jgi:hypothetical protein
VLHVCDQRAVAKHQEHAGTYKQPQVRQWDNLEYCVGRAREPFCVTAQANARGITCCVTAQADARGMTCCVAAATEALRVLCSSKMCIS